MPCRCHSINICLINICRWPHNERDSGNPSVNETRDASEPTVKVSRLQTNQQMNRYHIAGQKYQDISKTMIHYNSKNGHFKNLWKMELTDTCAGVNKFLKCMNSAFFPPICIFHEVSGGFLMYQMIITYEKNNSGLKIGKRQILHILHIIRDIGTETCRKQVSQAKMWGRRGYNTCKGPEWWQASCFCGISGRTVLLH